MARGKNYVNQNKGMMLSGGCTNIKATTSNNIAKQKKSSVVETCFYGAGCTRKDCIYKHPSRTTSTVTTTVNGIISTSSTSTNELLKSDAPCKPYLAGMCSFNSITCNKRHVTDPNEREKLLVQYSTIVCRHGIDCKQMNTGGCLYSHSTIPVVESNTNGSSTGSMMVPIHRKGGMLPPLPINNNGFYMNQQQQLLQQPNNINFCTLASSLSSSNNNNSQFGNEYTSNSMPSSSPVVPGSSLRVALPTGMIQQQQQQQQKYQQYQQTSSSSSTIPNEPMKSSLLHDTTFAPVDRLMIRNSSHSTIQQQSFASAPTTFQSAATRLVQQQQQQQQQQQPHHLPQQQYQSQHHYLKVPTQLHSGTVSSASSAVVITNNDIDFPPLGSLSVKDTTPTKSKVTKQQQQPQQSSSKIKSRSDTISNQSTTSSTTGSALKFNVNAQEFRPGGW